tara:strand:- start:63 stop:293 length:231 start_codon:yes stop_codon:yes gene_type:complete
MATNRKLLLIDDGSNQDFLGCYDIQRIKVAVFTDKLLRLNFTKPSRLLKVPGNESTVILAAKHSPSQDCFGWEHPV